MKILLKKILILTILVTKTSFIYSAAYNLPSHLINIPIYTNYSKGDILTGISSGITTSSNYRTEFDLNVYYAFTQKLIAGINLANVNNLVFNIHYNFYGNSLTKFKIAGGIVNIPLNGDNTISSFRTIDVIQKNAYSPYIVGTYNTSLINIHLGYGGENFKYASSENNHFSNLAGMIFGLEVPLKKASFQLEYDGKDFNIGSKIKLNNYSTIFVSLTEFGRDGNTNPQYNNQPIRWFTFGIKHRFNKNSKELEEEAKLNYKLSDDELNNIINQVQSTYKTEIENWRLEKEKLEEEILRLKNKIKNDLDYIDEKDNEKKEYLRLQYLTKTQNVSEKILKYYYESFELYTQNKHYEAIKKLQKAIALNPYLPQLYIRLGSIYYDLNLKEMAILQWEKALELDPYNIKLKNFLSTLN